MHDNRTHLSSLLKPCWGYIDTTGGDHPIWTCMEVRPVGPPLSDLACCDAMLQQTTHGMRGTMNIFLCHTSGSDEITWRWEKQTIIIVVSAPGKYQTMILPPESMTTDGVVKKRSSSGGNLLKRFSSRVSLRPDSSLSRASLYLTMSILRRTVSAGQLTRTDK